MTWSKPTLQEMKAFLGLCFLMGIDKKPTTKMHWTSDPYLHNDIYGKIMPRDRFYIIMRYLHFNDRETEPQIGDPGYNVLNKINEFVRDINLRFRENYIPGKRVSVDESIIPFKGRVKMKQYVPRKPVKWGIKLWAIADSVTSYLSYIEIYSGKSDQPERGLAANVVKKCIEGTGLQGQGYHVYMDNYFASPGLFTDLWDIYSTSACGTVRKVWRDLPPEFRKKKIDNVVRRGDMECRQKGPVMSVAWKDKKVVSVISTIHDFSTCVVTRNLQLNGQFQRVDVSCPVAISDYISFMGGVDKADQYTQYYAFMQKTLKWYKRVYFKILEMAKLNAYKCFLESPNHQPGPGKSPLTFLQFTRELIGNLVNGYEHRGSVGRPSLAPLEQRLVSRHMPGTFPNRSWCHVCWMRVSHGTQLTRKQTKYGCTDCRKHLCLPDCYTAYHTRNKYWL